LTAAYAGGEGDNGALKISGNRRSAVWRGILRQRKRTRVLEQNWQSTVDKHSFSLRCSEEGGANRLFYP